MSNHVANALIEALNDEYKARAIYRYVINTFGPIRPFMNIVEAESRHIQALLPLFHKYGIPVPPDTWDQRIDKPESVMDACSIGVEAEIENAEMYGRLLKATVDYPDIQRVMMHLQRASVENHLPAFQRCCARASRQPGYTGTCSRRTGMRGERGGRRYRGGRCGSARISEKNDFRLKERA
ncbi:MAG: DUF2202 domain-containing protein [Desulfobacterales bacterium]|nr:MAG: DUF2202 domain-containing protein [Desulfobacterales bacterium]